MENNQPPKETSPLSSDRPVVNPADDRLGYAAFSLNLARSISRMAPPEGLVIALYGPWGSGKSTVLRFVEHHLGQMKDAQSVVTVHFNPWWFSGHTDLTEEFFGQLDVALKRKKVWDKLRKGVAGLAATVAKAKDLNPLLGVGDAVAAVVDGPAKDVPALKEEIGKALVEKKVRLLVIIDDIDRLTAEEIRQVFRVVKAVADFPNTVYLLAFDKEVAVRALEQAQAVPGSGEEYLEKIVQVPFELPLPDRLALQRLLFERLDIVLATTPEGFFSQSYWTNTYHEGIDHFIQTPRDAVRLTNALQVTYPAIVGEINPVDFVGVEVLRVFCPAVYDQIRRNPQMFVGSTDFGGYSRGDDALKPFYEELLNLVRPEDQEAVKGLLMRLFPKARKVWQNMGHGADWERRWRRELRVCSGDIFPVYFRLALPQGAISNQEMTELLALSRDGEAFGKRLLSFSEEKGLVQGAPTRARRAVGRMEDFTEEKIPQENIAPIVRAMFTVGDQLVSAEPESLGMFDFGMDVEIGRVVWQLLKRLSEPERFALLRDVFSTSPSLEMITGEIATLSQQHGKFGAGSADPENERLLSSEHLQELEAIGLQRIRDFADGNRLLTSHRPLALLHYWKEWGHEDEPRAWAVNVVETDAGLLSLLKKSLGRSRRQTLGEVAVQVRPSLDPKALEPFLDPDAIVERVRALATLPELEEEARTAARQFVKEYDIRKAGGNPSRGVLSD